MIAKIIATLIGYIIVFVIGFLTGIILYYIYEGLRWLFLKVKHWWYVRKCVKKYQKSYIFQ